MYCQCCTHWIPIHSKAVLTSLLLLSLFNVFIQWGLKQCEHFKGILTSQRFSFFQGYQGRNSFIFSGFTGVFHSLVWMDDMGMWFQSSDSPSLCTSLMICSLFCMLTAQPQGILSMWYISQYISLHAAEFQLKARNSSHLIRAAIISS